MMKQDLLCCNLTTRDLCLVEKFLTIDARDKTKTSKGCKTKTSTKRSLATEDSDSASFDTSMPSASRSEYTSDSNSENPVSKEEINEMKNDV